MWCLHGMMAIPRDPQLKVSSPSGGTTKGRYLNFKAVTQGWSQGEEANYQYWEVSMWVPEGKVKEWEEALVPGNVFYVEHSYVISQPTPDGKYHNARIRLEYSRVKRLQKAMWAKE